MGVRCGSLVVVLACWAGIEGGSASACTTLCLRQDGRVVFGKNYDFGFDDGLLIVNKRGVARSADGDADKHAARWVSRFGSVTFNQFGRDQPMGGMNEAGLVIELMWAEGSRYPAPDTRAAVDCLEWIQYQLDNSATVAEVLSSDHQIRIESSVPLHYLVADRGGNVATIEFIEGALVAHTGTKLPVAALTNDFYSDSLRFLDKVRSALPGDESSLARFARAADRVLRFRSGDPVAYAFAALDDAHSSNTQWSIVYELDRGIIHFRTRSNPNVRTLSLSELDFSCTAPVTVLDLKAGAAGDIVRSLTP